MKDAQGEQVRPSGANMIGWNSDSVDRAHEVIGAERVRGTERFLHMGSDGEERWARGRRGGNPEAGEDEGDANTWDPGENVRITTAAVADQVIAACMIDACLDEAGDAGSHVVTTE